MISGKNENFGIILGVKYFMFLKVIYQLCSDEHSLSLLILKLFLSTWFLDIGTMFSEWLHKVNGNFESSHHIAGRLFCE